MAEPFRTTRLVEFHDTDMAGIMHFASFFHYMESAEHEFIRSLGFAPDMFPTDDPLEYLLQGIQEPHQLLCVHNTEMNENQLKTLFQKSPNGYLCLCPRSNRN